MPKFTTFQCPDCSNSNHIQLTTSEEYLINNQYHTIRNIPTLKCTGCGLQSYTFQAMEYVERELERIRKQTRTL